MSDVTLGLTLETGSTTVVAVTPGEFADIAGARVGDKLLEVDSQPVTNASEVRRALDTFKLHQQLTILVEREGAPVELTGLLTSRTGTLAAVGWYPNPTGQGPRLYWDGSQWLAPVTTAPTAQRTAPQTSVLAVVALVCAFVVPVVLPIVLGYAARRDVAQSNGAKTGAGLATAAIVLGWVFTILFLLYILLVLVALSGQ